MTINAMHIGGPHDGQVVMLSVDEPVWEWVGGTVWGGGGRYSIWEVPLVDTPDGYFLFWNEGKFV